LCIHKGNCVKGLPNVFKPEDKPWIQPEGTSTADLKATIDTCPSGALSYYMNNAKPSDEASEKVDVLEAQVIENGPLLLKGTVKIIHVDGTEEIKEKRSSICRCGKTGNNPFCDGSHNN